MNINSFDKIGTTGHNLIIKSLNRMDELAEEAKSMDQNDLASAAKTMAEMSRAKVGLYQGMYFVKAHRELSESMLYLMGVGCRC